MQPIKTTRRRLLRNIIATGTMPLIVPRHVAQSGQTPPSGKLRTAHIGVGGQGGGNLGAIAGIGEAQVTALCDVDSGRLAEAAKKHEKAKTFRDWRKLFESEADFDAIVVSTPDHHHAPAALTGMTLGKHAYVEKPLAHTIQEARLMTETAAKYKVVTQMGNSGHAGDGLRRWKESYDAGVKRTIKEVQTLS
jgi:predicted dehydrogenase